MAELLYRAPQSRREDVLENLHGVEINDPYRWLEDEEAAEVQAWVAAQNEHTQQVLASYPGREQIASRLADLLPIGLLTAPSVRHGRCFYQRREGEQNQPLLYWREGVAGSGRVLLDPNTANAGGTVALDWWYPSPDGRLLAYGYSDHGDEKSTLYVLEVDSGKQLGEQIPYTRYSSVAWLPDASGFYYTRYPAPGEVPAGEENYHDHIFFHKLGDDGKADPKVFGTGRQMTDMPAVELTEDGRFLIVIMALGWSQNELFVRDLHDASGGFVQIAAGELAIYDIVRVVEGTFYLHTNLGAPNFRIVAFDWAKPGLENWRTVVAERPDTIIQAAQGSGGRLLLNSLREVASHIEVYSLQGEQQAEVPLPPAGSVAAIGGEWQSNTLLIGYESYTQPPTVYRYDLDSHEFSTWAQVEAAIDSSQFVVEQVWYHSKDSTRVPMYVIARRDLARDGNNPTLLGGYGGFNVSRTPVFSRSALLWLERGGVYAVANLRGGSEFGEDWHQAGMLGNKQNVFDDFIAAAEYLIAEGYTRPEKLAIMGGSNGGLLVGASLTQRPDLFKAVICAVPLLDMIRYHHFRIARLWVSEYGSAEDAEQFAWLRAYSPYHNVRPGTRYPAILITTGASDSRVDPLHARKMAALLQTVSDGSRPVLVRVEDEAGHGQGKPLTKLIAEQTDIWSFLAWQLGL